MTYWQPNEQDYLDMEAADAAAAAAALDTPDLTVTAAMESPGEIHAPETAGLLGEGRRAVESPSPRSSSPAPSETSALSGASQDSFDWIGDDRREGESDYEEAFFEELSASPCASAGASAPRPRGSGLCHAMLVVVFLGCSAVLVARELRVPMPVIWEVGLYRWALILFATTFVPVWVSTGLAKLATALKSTQLAKTDHPARLEASRLPLTLMIASVVVGALWVTSFPKSCLDGHAGFCYYAYIPRLFLFLLIAGFILTVDVLLMMAVRSSFQEGTFKDKIIESRFKVHVLDQLLQAACQERSSRHAAPSERQRTTAEAQAGWSFMYDLPFILPALLARLFRTRRRATNDGRMADFAEYSEQIARSLQTRGYESVATAPPRNDHKAKVMARMIFHYLSDGRKLLVQDDFARIIKSEAACRDAYCIFDTDRDGTITRSEFRNAAVRIFKEQRNLAQSVANTGSALSILDTISMLAVGAGLFLLLLALFGVRVQNILGVSASFILGMNFIIYDAANKTFHALLFLFVMHPYDIGDRIVIGKDFGYGDEDVMTATHINIQNTIFRKWNGMLVSMPNHVLAMGAVTNLSRGLEQWERVDFALEAPDQQRLTVDEETARLAELRRLVEAFVLAYPQDYFQSFELRAVIAADVGKSEQALDRIKFVLKVRCRETTDSQKKWIRHARILSFVKSAIRQVDVRLAAA